MLEHLWDVSVPVALSFVLSINVKKLNAIPGKSQILSPEHNFHKCSNNWLPTESFANYIFFFANVFIIQDSVN